MGKVQPDKPKEDEALPTQENLNPGGIVKTEGSAIELSSKDLGMS